MAPKYTEARGWAGGDPRRLYAITDRRTGRMIVRPVETMNGIGPEVIIRPATKQEAETHWQNPLHSGWKVTQ